MISVIVPIYNVEPYLIKCLDSLVQLKRPAIQDLKDFLYIPETKNISAKERISQNKKKIDFEGEEEIEILLIDDGSTDRCGQIAEDYAQRYSCFRVFHTSNQGLSAARNYGIEKAQGDWLMFVDSDDWVSPDFCRIPYRAAVENNADLVIFQFSSMIKNGKARRNRNTSIVPDGLVNRETAIDYGHFNIWCKLYKTKLFDTIRFPDGRIYEDVLITHKLIYEAERIYMLNDQLIYHRYRFDSISHTRSVENKKEELFAFVHRYYDLVVLGYPGEKALFSLQHKAFLYCCFINPDDDEWYRKAERIVDTIKGIPGEVGFKSRCMLVVWKINKNWFHWICRILGKKIPLPEKKE